MRGTLLLAGVLLFAGSACAQPFENVVDPGGAEFSIDADGVGTAQRATDIASEARSILAQPDYRRMRVREVEVREFEPPKWTWPKWLQNLLRPIGRFFQG